VSSRPRPTHEEGLRAVEAAESGRADVEARGTCQVCLMHFAVRGQVRSGGKMSLVKHGYKRPGVGWLVGECKGTGHPPFELDCQLTRQWRDLLRDVAVPDIRATIAGLVNRTINTFPVQVYDRTTYRYVDVEITEGSSLPEAWTSRSSASPDYARARERAVKVEKGRLAAITAEIVHLGKVIEGWRYVPEKLAPKEKALTEGQSIRRWLESSHAELASMPGPAGRDGRPSGKSFLQWAQGFPNTMAWTSRSGHRLPSYYKRVRREYEKLTGAAALAVPRPDRDREVTSREGVARREAREAKLRQREQAAAQKSERASRTRQKATADIRAFQKLFADALSDPKLRDALRASPRKNPYTGAETGSRLEFVTELVERYHLRPFVDGHVTFEKFVYGDAPRSSEQDGMLLSKRRDLRDIWDILREEAREVGFKLPRVA
jgi:hypothetical protein